MKRQEEREGVGDEGRKGKGVREWCGAVISIRNGGGGGRKGGGTGSGVGL